jgi:uncharacterized GH25 family protein
MQTRFVKQFAIAITLAGIACAAQAHRPWMIPNTTLVETDNEAWVTIDGSISEDLFESDFRPLRLDGLTVTGPDGVTAPAPAATVGKFRSSVDIRLPSNGTYRITLATTRDVRGAVIHQRQDIFVTANKPSSGALKPTGTGLELVPVTHPNELRAGEKATFRFMLNGQPLPNFPFSLTPGGVKYRGTLNEVRLATDAKGEARFTLPAPNMYWLSAKFPANAPATEPADAKRYSYSATLEILPE